MNIDRVSIRAAVVWCIAVVLTTGLCEAQTTPDSSDAAVAEKLHAQAMKFVHSAKYAEAESLLERALAIQKKTLGEEHQGVARSMGMLGQVYAIRGRYAKAEKALAETLRIQEKTLGQRHPDLAVTLGCLASLHYKQDKLPQALAEYKRTLNLFQKAYGRENPRTTGTLHDIGQVCKDMGKFQEANQYCRQAITILTNAKQTNTSRMADFLLSTGQLQAVLGRKKQAEELYERALAIQKRSRGLKHPKTAIVYYELAQLRSSQGLHAKSEPLYQQALAIWESVLPPGHPTLATAVMQLATAYAQQGKHAKAEILFKRVVAMHEARWGPNDYRVAQALRNLALLLSSSGRFVQAEAVYGRVMEMLKNPGASARLAASVWGDMAGLRHRQGRYADSERLYKRALDMYQNIKNPDPTKMADLLNNLSLLYSDQGRYTEASEACMKNLRLNEKARGPDHPEVATSLNNVARFHRIRGQYAKAEKAYLSAMEIRKKAFGADHPEVGDIIHNLALLYKAQQRYKECEAMLKDVLARDLKGRPYSLDHAQTLNNLGWLYDDLKQYTKAKDYYQGALQIRLQQLGPEHPKTARVMWNLSLVSLSEGQLSQAWDYGKRARGILRRFRMRASSSAITRSMSTSRIEVNGVLPCLALKLGKGLDPLNLVEQEQGLALRELLGRAQATGAYQLTAAERKQLESISTAMDKLAMEINSRARGSLPISKLQNNLLQTQREYETFAGKLREKHGQLAGAMSSEITSEAALASPVLDDNTAIVGWADHPGCFAWAYIIRKGGIKWVDCSATTELMDDLRLVEKLLASYRSRSKTVPPVKSMGDLYRRRIAPLEVHLKGVKKLIVIAQGWSALCPLDTLLTADPPANTEMSDWPWLGKKYEISYAPSVTTLDILCRKRVKRKGAKWPRSLFALADPPFGQEHLTQMKSEKAIPEDPILATAGPGESFLTRVLQLDPTAVPARIPGTRREVQAIADVLGAEQSLTLLGPNACERKLFELNASGELARYRYIHIATHGFANSDRPELSGLVLARVPVDKQYDGILEMREVFRLKLDADLVVLSACQTGLGRRLGGEGVVGLSTAFFSAGTVSLVISLWDVPDAPTALLMQKFYLGLKSGKSKAAALSQAKTWLRNVTHSELDKLGRANRIISGLTRSLGRPTAAPKGRPMDVKPFAHPHYWAGFVLTGDPGK